MINIVQSHFEKMFGGQSYENNYKSHQNHVYHDNDSYNDYDNYDNYNNYDDYDSHEEVYESDTFNTQHESYGYESYLSSSYCEYDDSSEYESDDICSTRSSLSYSSLESHDFVDTNVSQVVPSSFPVMSTILEDFTMIDKLLIASSTQSSSKVIQSPIDMKNSDKSISNDTSNDDLKDTVNDVSELKESSPSTPSTQFKPWKSLEVVSQTEHVSLSTIMENEEMENIRNREEEKKRMSEMEQRNKYPNRKSSRQPNKQQRTTHHERPPERPKLLQSSKSKEGIVKESVNKWMKPPQIDNKGVSKSKIVNENKQSIRRRSLLLRDDPQSSSNNESVSVCSTTSGSTTTNTNVDLTRICKFGKACKEMSSKCGRSHALDEWSPRQCRQSFKSCRSGNRCRYIHSSESKKSFLRRILDFEDTFYNKNKEMYLKNFKLS